MEVFEKLHEYNDSYGDTFNNKLTNSNFSKLEFE